MIAFTKMHGAGNDFIMIAPDAWPAAGLNRREIAQLCDRRLGVGADGLITLAAVPEPDVAFRMVYFNADGGEAEMCGNGARCSVAFAHELGLVGSSCRFRTQAGLHEGTWHGPGDIEVSLPGWQGLELDLADLTGDRAGVHACHTGVPHLVIPVADVERIDVVREGAALRHDARFAPAGTNVNWVSRRPDADEFLMRTYERGVEDETLACGTGAAAIAVVLCRLGQSESPVALRTRGGDLLRVGIDTEAGILHLRGPAVTSFTGEVAIDD